jgi:flavorubredoxin
MSTFPVSEHASWVGALDWNLRDFHGLYCPRGGSYNAYLVRGAKAAVIDSVYTPFAGQLLQHLKELVDPAEISYIESPEKVFTVVSTLIILSFCVLVSCRPLLL